MTNSPDRQHRWLIRAVVFSSSAALALAAVVVYQARVLRGPGAGTSAHLQELLDEPGVREEVVAELVDAGGGIYDSHVDAEVGRILQPGLRDRLAEGIPVTTNAFGMREQEYELPKPAGVLRVVLLGDSFVYGAGVSADERLGVHLRDALRERATGFDGTIEVLHLGVPSWNVLAECAYVRRQLSLLQPDLLVQVTVQNDLDDLSGVRGFGARATFSPQWRRRADGMLRQGFPRSGMHGLAFNHLAEGLDHESRSRFAEAREAILALADAVERRGGRYLLVLNWGAALPVVADQWARHLDPAQVVYLTKNLRRTESVISQDDPHWSASGHVRLATLLYGIIRERELLPRLALAEWEAAAREVASLLETGREEARDLEGFVATQLARRPIASSIDFRALDEDRAAQVHGGIDQHGLLGPYGSVVLAAEGSRLRVSGVHLDRPELQGAEIAVRLDGELLGSIVVDAGREFERTWPLPVDGDPGGFVTVSWEATDFAYRNVGRQRCVVTWLRFVAVE